MPSVILQTNSYSGTLVSQRMRVSSPDGTTQDIPLFDIERVVVSENCESSIQLIVELMRREIPLIFTRWTGDVAGICAPPSAHGALRMLQYAAVNNPLFVVSVAAVIVEAKILNSRRVLQKLINSVPTRVATNLAFLAKMAEEVIKADTVETIMGYEGIAAAKYFEDYGKCFPAETPFEFRSRRPPHNAPNSILSYCYTVMAGEAETCLCSVGLDPALGFLHRPEDGRFSLALDVIEPFRSVVADALAVDLLSHGTLHPIKHFENKEGGIYLNSDGKKRFFVAYERRMDRAFTSVTTGLRTTLRDEFVAVCVGIKNAVQDDSQLIPFYVA